MMTVQKYLQRTIWRECEKVSARKIRNFDLRLREKSCLHQQHSASELRIKLALRIANSTQTSKRRQYHTGIRQTTGPQWAYIGNPGVVGF